MPASCSAYGCTNRHYKGTPIHFHSFPFSREKVLKAWIHAVRRKNFKPTKSSVICSAHFRETDFIKNNRGRVLKHDAVPSVFENFPAHLTAEADKRKTNAFKKLSKLVNHEVNIQEFCGKAPYCGESSQEIDICNLASSCGVTCNILLYLV